MKLSSILRSCYINKFNPNYVMIFDLLPGFVKALSLRSTSYVNPLRMPGRLEQHRPNEGKDKRVSGCRCRNILTFQRRYSLLT